MFIDALILVLRETLEAGILISLLLVAVRQYRLGSRAVMWAMPFGLLCALLYAHALPGISQWWDYRGQEVVNAALQVMIYFAVVVVVAGIWMKPVEHYSRLVPGAAAVAVVLATTREGSEVYIFLRGFTQMPSGIFKLIACGLMGLGIGISAGALSYYALVMMPCRIGRVLQGVLLSLIGAGLLLQAAQLVNQVDLLPSGLPLWDSSGLLTESTITGQLFYAVFGYEATPSLTEVIAYLSGMGLIVLPGLYVRSRSLNKARQPQGN